jgi:hypothetical protein
VDATVRKMVTYLPDGPLLGVEQVERRVGTSPVGVPLEDFILQDHYAHGWVLWNVELLEHPGHATADTIYVKQLPESMQAANAFFRPEIPLVAYLVPLLALLVFAFFIATMVVAAFTPIGPRKWLWVAVSVIGVTQFHFNWISGAWDTAQLEQRRLEPIGANPARGLPHDPHHSLDGVAISWRTTASPRCLARLPAKQSDRVLAVVAGHRAEVIQQLPSLPPAGCSICS